MKDFLGGLINPHDRKMNQIKKRVDKILSMEDSIASLSDEELKNKTEEFKNRLQNEETLDIILEEAFAVVREASHRVLGMKHFPVQLIGGIALHEGNISEMKTGEGKTLVATLPTYLNALTEKGVFVITVNEYLAQRDKEEMGKIHEFLGLSVGFIKRQMDFKQKKQAYECDIVYGTNSEFGFDYLRDNMAILKEQIVQTELNYAIIDEIDSILIDEARTPLIMTDEAARPSQYYVTVDKFAKSLNKEDYEKDNEKGTINLTESGMDKAESIFSLENIVDSKNAELLHHIRQALSANYIIEKDKDYVVDNGEVVIVDKFTGRLMQGRRFSNGLHQALEAKENLEIKKESKTVAMITYQNYFRMFKKICGMTGTAHTEKAEFKEIYGMDVICIPTNKPVQRINKDDLVFKTKEAKFEALVDEVKTRHDKGQPVLIGTIFIDESEEIAELLDKNGVKYNILNAKQDQNEAQIIENAGQIGAITIATNMAGRGTDIKLNDEVQELGGLCVIGTERHDSRRIDNQLRGRSGRQGDPGISQFYVSLEDSIFKKVKPEVMTTVKKLVDKMGIKEDEAIQDKMVSQSIQGVQKNVEIANYNARKSTLEFDQILNKQRETIYAERNKILNGEDMSDFIKDIIADFINENVDEYTSMSEYPEEWELEKLKIYIKDTMHLDIDELVPEGEEELHDLDKDDLKESIVTKSLEIYSQKEEELGLEQLRYLERLTLMKSIDEKWTDHLDIVDQLRQGIGFQHIGGQNPIRVFNKEAFELFEAMMSQVKELTIKSLFLLANINSNMNNEKKNLVQLEDKYNINRKNMTTIPANTPTIKFNIDINATEEVSANIGMYYMEDGNEENIESYNKSVQVKGIFSIEFEKPKDRDWKMGWHQVKVLVSGQEATVINFLVTEAEQMPNNVQEIKFFSELSDEVSFSLSLRGYKKESINAGLMVNGNKENIIPLEFPVKDEKVKVAISTPDKGWGNSIYELILLFENNNIILPFMMVQEFSQDDEELRIKVDLNIKTEENIEMIAQLIYLEENEVIKELPVTISKSGSYLIGLKKDKIWKQGKYEFRMNAFNQVAFRKYLLIS